MITGKEELLTVKVKVDSEVSPSPGNAVVMPPFEKDEYELLLEHNFLEREIAIVKVSSRSFRCASQHDVWPASR